MNRPPETRMHLTAPDGRALAVTVGPAQTLLEAALAAGLPMRRSCRNGTCRACMARLVSGAVDYRVEWPGLLAEEKAQGWVLPCVACACTAELVLTAVPWQA